MAVRCGSTEDGRQYAPSSWLCVDPTRAGVAATNNRKTVWSEFIFVTIPTWTVVRGILVKIPS
jgi:hypothetical protein